MYIFLPTAVKEGCENQSFSIKISPTPQSCRINLRGSNCCTYNLEHHVYYNRLNMLFNASLGASLSPWIKGFMKDDLTDMYG